MPGDDDLWDNALSIDVQYIVWNTPTVGFAVSGGIGSWEANDDIYYGYGLAGQADGSAKTFPLGASVLFKPVANSSAEITIETGLKYVIVDSSVDGALTDGVTVIIDDFDIDNGFVGLLAADIAIPVSPKFNLGIGAGYQFDISKGDISWGGIDTEDNELKGFFLRLGLNFKI